MEKCVGKRIKITYVDESSEETFCEQFIRKEDDEKVMLFYLIILLHFSQE